jgi:tetratricopeptide (TPR) repeat protein
VVPYCQLHPEIELEPKKKGWFCDECGAIVLGYGSNPGTDAPATFPSPGREFEGWPSVVAIPVARALAEVHPVLKLHRLCDAVEIMVRFATVVQLAQFQNAEGQPCFAPKLRALVSSTIERPTLGAWGRILEHLGGELRATGTPPVIPALEGYAVELLGLLFGSGRVDGAVDGSRPDVDVDCVLDLRNLLVHGGALSNRAAARFLSEWHPRVLATWRKGAFLDESSLLFIGVSATLRLRGTRRPVVVGAVPDVLEDQIPRLQNHVVLVFRDRLLDLWPFCILEPGEEADRTMIYYRAGRRKLLYAVLEGDPPVAALRDSFAGFEQLFVLSEGATATAVETTDFERELRTDSAALVGRLAELAHVKRQLKGAQTGVFWLHGPAGIGKSFLSARLAEDLRGDPRKSIRIAWRFRSGDPRCAKSLFLRHAVERLSEWLDRPSPVAAQGKLEHSLRALLGTVAQFRPDASNRRARRVLFFLDGLDEIVRTDPGVSEIPFRLCFPNVVWVCSGRAEGELSAKFAPTRCTVLFPGGLPPMSPNDVRGMLLDVPGDLKYGLLRRDSVQSTNQVSNPFVETVVQNARGLPLYVRCVIEDVLAGECSFHDERRLPRGLSEYYRRILERLSVGDIQALVTPVVMTVALAHCPLDLDALLGLLVTARRLVPGHSAYEFLALAIDRIGSLITPAPTPWGTKGWNLAHETLREFLLEAADTAQQRELVKEDYCRTTTDVELLPEGTARTYVFLYGPTHLAHAGKYDRFLDLLADGRFASGTSAFFAHELSGLDCQPDVVQAVLARAVERRIASASTALLPAIESAIDSGRYSRVEPLFEPIAALCDPTTVEGRHGSVMLEYFRAWILRARGLLQEATTQFEALAFVDAGEAEERIRFQYANTLRESGQYDRARPNYQALYLSLKAQPTRLREFLVFAQQYADILYVQGNLRQAVSILSDAECDAGNPTSYAVELAEVLRIRGHVMRMSEELGAAEQFYRRAGELFRKQNHIFGMARIETNLCETLAQTNPDLAIQHGVRAVDMNRNLGSAIEVGKAQGALGLAWLARRRPDRALKLMNGARDLQERVGYRSGVGMALVNLLQLHLSESNDDLAVRTFDAVRELFHALHAYPILVYRAAKLLMLHGVVKAGIEVTLENAASQVDWLEGRSRFDGLLASPEIRRGGGQ